MMLYDNGLIRKRGGICCGQRFEKAGSKDSMPMFGIVLIIGAVGSGGGSIGETWHGFVV